ncbi:hypothetical protein BH23PLA1_BH23PLA1_09870 [soil metagenome]
MKKLLPMALVAALTIVPTSLPGTALARFFPCAASVKSLPLDPGIAHVSTTYKCDDPWTGYAKGKHVWKINWACTSNGNSNCAPQLEAWISDPNTGSIESVIANETLSIQCNTASQVDEHDWYSAYLTPGKTYRFHVKASNLNAGAEEEEFMNFTVSIDCPYPG